MEDAERGPVADHVVHHQQQHPVGVAQADQREVMQRAVGQVDRARGLLGDDRFDLGLGVRALAHVEDGQLELGRVEDHLDRLAFDHVHDRAEGLVPPDDLGEAPLERRHVHLAAQPVGLDHVERRAVLLDLRQEPEPLLWERQRQVLISRDLLHARRAARLVAAGRPLHEADQVGLLLFELTAEVLRQRVAGGAQLQPVALNPDLDVEVLEREEKLDWGHGGRLRRYSEVTEQPHSDLPEGRGQGRPTSPSFVASALPEVRGVSNGHTTSPGGPGGGSDHLPARS